MDISVVKVKFEKEEKYSAITSTLFLSSASTSTVKYLLTFHYVSILCVILLPYYIHFLKKKHCTILH